MTKEELTAMKQTASRAQEYLDRIADLDFDLRTIEGYFNKIIVGYDGKETPLRIVALDKFYIEQEIAKAIKAKRDKLQKEFDDIQPPAPVKHLAVAKKGKA